MRNKWVLWCILLLLPLGALAQLSGGATADSILGHQKQFDADGKLLPWYNPHVPGAGYVEVARLASGFVKNAPVYEPLGLKMYYVSCCFQGPRTSENGEFVAEAWMHNPACIWAGMVQSLVVDYRVFSGDDSYIEVVREMLDYQLEHGTTPPDWAWASVPYASADPFKTEYHGAEKWQNDGMRGDGLHGIEPDKVGELGVNYLKFYQVTEEKRFLEAAIHCADALAKNVRDVRPENKDFVLAETSRSPWPFRVQAETNEVSSEYCSNVVEPIRLFEELVRNADRLGITPEEVGSYKKARQIAWEWLYSINGPMKTYIWNAYFEDIPNDPDQTNRVQITPMETARHLVKHPELDPDLDNTVPALIHWVASAFGTDGMDAIKEQTWCYLPMGSHTSRYASLCALWYEHTGEEWYRDQAERFFNFATYMCFDDGVVAVGHNWPGSWWSDGYGDYIRHFMEGLAAIPEWAPAGENHLLKSSSVVQSVKYNNKNVRYRTWDDHADEVLRLASKPVTVTVNGKQIEQTETPVGEGWTWRQLDNGGVLKISHESGHDIEITL